MTNCPRCGTILNGIERYCADCGAKIEGAISHVGQSTEEFIEKKSHKGFIILMIFLIIGGYAVLDLWAISSLTPVVSVGGIVNSITNFDADVSLSETSVSSTIRIKNPTFIPILFGRISYDVNYGNTKMADGKTGFFIMGPNSEKDIPVGLTINHASTGWAILKGIGNAITGTQERTYSNFYADFIITKVKLQTLG